MSTGYGPRHKSRLYFDGNEESYELWEVKFLGYLRLQNLLDVIEGEENGAADDGSETSSNGTVGDKNACVFAEMVQLLDDKSLSLIIRDAKNDGRQALEILRQHYLGKSKPRVIALYTELTTLTKSEDETVTDYIIRIEKTTNSLTAAGETLSDGLVVAMALKGLAKEYSSLVTVISQRDQPMTFGEFKIALRNYEETEKSRGTVKSKDSVMKQEVKHSSGTVRCYNCNKVCLLYTSDAADE